MIGQTISHYKILDKLGEGGMGVVYKAEDTNLKREVAIKFLPRQIAANEEEGKRFKIEAQAAAALNHANIATIYNIEEVDDEMFIVMEYIKGQELKDKIEAGPIPIYDTLNLAIQIAQGLQAAHEEGVVHRDIKSANIMLTLKGSVKIMDFGLAKISGKTKLTKEGTTLGTVAYMSPEQARGDEVDHRSDIFSLGVLLYEMLTGQLPFKGDYDPAITYSVMNEDPEPITALRTGIPMEFERIVNKCLQKEPSARYQGANELLVDLHKLKKEAETKELISKSTVETSQPKAPKPTYLVLATIGLTILTLVLGYLIFGRGPKGSVLRLINPRQLTSGIGVETHPTWSPDGGLLAYTAWLGGVNSDIWVIQLGGGQPVNRTQDHAGLVLFPSWSPDGTQIAFWSDRDGDGFYVMPAVGGKPRSLGVKKGFLKKPIWLGAKELAYAAYDSGGVYVEILSLESRETRRLSLPGRNAQRIGLNWSPVRQAFAYVDAISETADVTQLWFVQASNGDAFPISDGLWNDRSPTWSADGSILYFVSNRGGSMDLWQLNMPKDGKPKGPPEQLTVGIGMREAVFSPDGSRLAYSKGRRVANLWRIRIPKPGDELATWASAEQITFDNALIEFVDLSPDGRNLLFSSDRTGNQDIWKMEVVEGELEQLTTNPTPDWNPMLSPDGEQIVFYSYLSGNRDIWVMPIGGGAARQLTNFEGPDISPSWSPDSKMIAFASNRGGNGDIWVLPTDGGRPTRFTKDSANDMKPQWSPDGEKIAFLSDRNQDNILNLWMMPATGGERCRRSSGRRPPPGPAPVPGSGPARCRPALS